MRPRTFVGLLLVAVGSCAGAAWWLVTDAAGPEGAPAADAADATADGGDGDATSAALRDDDGRVLRRADGTSFPPGSRREGARVVTPDGRVWRRTGEGWVADGEEPTTERRRVDPAVIAAERAAAEEARARETAPPPPVALPGKRPGGERVETAALHIRAAPTDPVAGDAAAPADAASAGWTAADGSLAAPGTTTPRLDVFREPEAARGRVRDHVREEQAAEETAAVVAQYGLRGDYFDLLDGELYDVPVLDGLVPSFSRIDLAIDFSIDDDFKLPFEPETFAVRWTGFLVVDAGGDYTFTCGSDDGARLSIDGTEVFAHRSLRPYAETSGTIRLEPGRHPLLLEFYENRVYASCRLFWEGPVGAKRPVPSSAFRPPDTLAGVVQPHVARIDPPDARLGETVTLTGLGFAATPAANRVRFAGVPGEVLEAAEDRLVVRVPVGAQTGDVTVQVGDLTSLPRAFTVESLIGLFAEYYLIGQDLGEMPDLDTLTPYFVRLDGPLDYHQDLLWELPYAPDVFAARYRGFIWFPEDGDYRVTLGSDDGARMTLDGVEYLHAPGLHPYREVARVTRFTQGFHPVEISFFENRGVARLRLFWQRPGEPERVAIPRGFLFPPEALASAVPPQIGGVAPAAVGETIEVRGSGFGSDASMVRVRFGGEAWARPVTCEDGRLTAVVPRQAASGELRVEVGVLASNAVQWVRTTPVGLTADVYVFGSEDELRATRDPAAFAERAPHLTRIDTTWRLERATEWNLPFPAHNFAVHWHGTLGIDTAVSIGWILQADDGAHLYVDGRHVLDNGPFHGLQERFGQSDLQPGDHTFDLWYFQADGDAKLHLFWNPYGLQDHRAVPAEWFRPDRPAEGN